MPTLSTLCITGKLAHSGGFGNFVSKSLNSYLYSNFSIIRYFLPNPDGEEQNCPSGIITLMLH